MAIKKISEFTELSSIQDDDVFLVERDGAGYSVKASVLKQYFGTGGTTANVFSMTVKEENAVIVGSTTYYKVNCSGLYDFLYGMDTVNIEGIQYVMAHVKIANETGITQFAKDNPVGFLGPYMCLGADSLEEIAEGNVTTLIECYVYGKDVSEDPSFPDGIKDDVIMNMGDYQVSLPFEVKFSDEPFSEVKFTAELNESKIYNGEPTIFGHAAGISDFLADNFTHTPAEVGGGYFVEGLKVTVTTNDNTTYSPTYYVKSPSVGMYQLSTMDSTIIIGVVFDASLVPDDLSALNVVDDDVFIMSSTEEFALPVTITLEEATDTPSQGDDTFTMTLTTGGLDFDGFREYLGGDSTGLTDWLALHGHPVSASEGVVYYDNIAITVKDSGSYQIENDAPSPENGYLNYIDDEKMGSIVFAEWGGDAFFYVFYKGVSVLEGMPEELVYGRMPTSVSPVEPVTVTFKVIDA